MECKNNRGRFHNCYLLIKRYIEKGRLELLKKKPTLCKSTPFLLGVFAFMVLLNSFTIGQNGVSLPYGVFAKETQPYGGMLRAGLPFFFEIFTLNPLIPGSGEGCFGSQFVHNSVFNNLLRYDESGFAVSDLAKNWTVSGDGLNYTFSLFRNVTWHDGVEFNASDVKFSYDTISSNPDVVQYWTNLWEGEVPEAIIKDEYTVSFRFQNVDASALHAFAWTPVIPKHLYEGTDLETNPSNEHPIGTGPFKFVNWTQKTGINLTANDEYFRGRPYLDHLFLRWDIPIVELTDFLMNNTIDIVPIYASLDRIDEFEQTPGVSTISRVSPSVREIAFNLSHRILNELKGRQALAHAINKTAICEQARLGYSTPATGPIYPMLGYWYNSNVTEYGFNQTLAEELLDEAGYSRDPQTMTRFTIDYSLFDEVHNNTAQMVEQYWQQIGINVTVQVRPIGEILGDFEMFHVGFGGFMEPSDQYVLWHSNGAWNYWSYNNSRIDYLLETGRTTLNITEQKEIYDEVQQILADEIPHLFLHYPTILTAYNNDFHGFISGSFVYSLNAISLEKVWYEPTLSGEGNCPYRVCFVDSEGRQTGFFNGTSHEDIPNSTYTGVDNDPQLVKIRNPLGVYNVSLIGVENGSYSFEFVNIALDYKNVQVVEGHIHENETITYIIKSFEDGTMKVYDPEEYSSHDVGIMDVASPKTVIAKGFSHAIDVTVLNYGDYLEEFNVTFYANTTMIQNESLSLTSGESRTITYTLNTTDLHKGNYTITIIVTPVLGEIATTDNTAQRWIIIAMMGDITGPDGWPDGECDMRDVGLVARYFGQDVPSAPANCDLTGPVTGVPDGTVDMRDVGLVARHFGETDP